MNNLDPFLPKGLERELIVDERVKRALSRVPRHHFMPESHREEAYEDKALPIGNGQTISQPFIVALMTQAVEVDLGSKVLEIGTGSGYQAAVLSELGAKVYSVETIPELSRRAFTVLRENGYSDIRLKIGDGFLGWHEEAPFDVIVVTASAPVIPVSLLSQLSNRGKLILPLEKEKSTVLTLVEKNGDDLISSQISNVRFVPMIGLIREENQVDISTGTSILEKKILGE